VVLNDLADVSDRHHFIRNNLHGRADRWLHPRASRESFAGRHSLHRRHAGDDHHARLPLHAEESDSANNRENERHPARCGRDHEEPGEIGHGNVDSAVHGVRSDQPDVHYCVDRTTNRAGSREKQLPLHGFQLADRLQRPTVLQQRVRPIDRCHDVRQHVYVLEEIQHGYIHNASGVAVDGAVSVHGDETGDTVPRSAACRKSS